MSILNSLNQNDIVAAAWILYWFIPILEPEIIEQLEKEEQQLEKIWNEEINIETHPSLRPAAEMEYRKRKARMIFRPIFKKVMKQLHRAGYFLEAKAGPPTRIMDLEDMAKKLEGRIR